MISKKTTIYLVRHAMAAGNKMRAFHGHTDGALVDEGAAQLPLLTRRFADIPLDAVYSSDLTRARLTAEALDDARDLPVFTTPLLREIHAGKWEGMMYDDILAKYPDMLNMFLSGDPDCRPYGGESIAEVMERMRGAVDTIAGKHRGQAIAIVSHGGALRAYLTSACGYNQSVPNASVSCVEYYGETVKLIYAGDVGHLAI